MRSPWRTYLLAAKDLPPGESRTFEVGGTDVVGYGDLIREYARQRGLRRWLISVPLLTTYLGAGAIRVAIRKPLAVGKT